MGDGQPPLHHDTAQDVSACLRARAERGRAYGLLRLPTWPAKAGPQGRCICHPAGRTPDQKGEVQIPLFMKYKNSRGYQGLSQRARTHSRGGGLLRRPPGA